MTAPDPGLDPLERRVRRHQSRMMPLARTALIWERLWPRLWPTAGIVGTFIALALFDVLPLFRAGCMLPCYSGWQRRWREHFLPDCGRFVCRMIGKFARVSSMTADCSITRWRRWMMAS